MKRFGFIGYVICSLFAVSVQGQIRISEFCPSNTNNWVLENGDSPDWIEIYNAGSTTINLEGYALSDNPLAPRKWIFDEIDLAPDTYLLINASGDEEDDDDDEDDEDGQLFANFKLSKQGGYVVLSDPEQIIQELKYSATLTDHSHGFIQGHDNLFLFSSPTPGQANTSQHYESYCEQPEIRVSKADFLSKIELGSEKNTILYTLNGENPIINGSTYTIPIISDTTVVIKAITSGASCYPSEPVVRTVFQAYETNLSIISLTTDPEHLWGEDHGIFVRGNKGSDEHPYFGSNLWNNFEAPTYLEYFDKNQNPLFQQLVGMKLQGGSSARTRPQKALRLIARSDYGKSKMNFTFMYNRPLVNEFDKIVLRNSGGDFNQAHFRDGIIHDIAHQAGLHHDLLAYEPLAVFINGSYWGILNLRDKVGDDYIHYLHGHETDNLDLIEEDTGVINGDLDRFVEMTRTLTRMESSHPDFEATAHQHLDMSAYFDYFISETFWANTDWPRNNIKCWRPRTPDGKWRYIQFDLDASLGAVGWIHPHTDALGILYGSELDNTATVQIFRKVVENSTLQEQFVTRYLDLLNTCYSQDNVLSRIDSIVEILTPEMVKHRFRWGEKTIDWWHNYHLGLVYEFASQRTVFARQFLMDQYGYEDSVKVSISWPEDWHPNLQLNSIQELNNHWEGYYFTDLPLHLKVPAGRCTHWVVNGEMVASNSCTLELTPTEDLTIEIGMTHPLDESPLFKVIQEGSRIIVRKGPLFEGEVSYQLHDIRGKIVTEWVSPANESISSPDISLLKNALYILTAVSHKGLQSQKLIIR